LLLTAVLLYMLSLPILFIGWCLSWNTHSNYHHMIWLYIFHSCVRRLCGLLLHHLETDFGQIKFSFVYSDTSIRFSGMCCFPTSIIHYFWSWKIAYISNASLYQMYCFSKCVFLMSFIHSGFLALTYSWKHNFQENVA